MYLLDSDYSYTDNNNDMCGIDAWHIRSPRHATHALALLRRAYDESPAFESVEARASRCGSRPAATHVVLSSVAMDDICQVSYLKAKEKASHALFVLKLPRLVLTG